MSREYNDSGCCLPTLKIVILFFVFTGGWKIGKIWVVNRKKLPISDAYKCRECLEPSIGVLSKTSYPLIALGDIVSRKYIKVLNYLA